MMRTTRRQPLGHLAELNVTPLLDLSFVLLVIFMITAPLLGNRNIDVQLPTSLADANAPPEKNYYFLIVDEKEALYLEDTLISREEIVTLLKEKIAEAEQNEETIAVVIKADARLRVDQIVPVFDLLVKAGVVNTALVSKPSQG